MTATAPFPTRATDDLEDGLPVSVRVVGYLLATWCLGFALVNAWDLLVGGLPGGDAFADYAAGLAVMSVLVLLLKVAGAAVAVAAVRPRRRPSWLLATATWGAASLLALYSVGNLGITLGTVLGLVEPSAAWTAAGGVTARAIAYVVFFVAGAAMFTVLAVSYQRRHRPRWTAAAAGIVGAPVLLAGVLVVVPDVLAESGWMPT